MENENKLFSSKEAAHYLGISDNTLRQYRINGTGPLFIKKGKRVFYQNADLNHWLTSLPKFQSISQHKEEMRVGSN